MTPAHSAPPASAWAGLIAALTARAVVNPRLALDLLGMVWAYRARTWYRRVPFLPLPPASYVAWRLHTAYGDAAAVPPLEDVIRLARWRRKLLDL